jgi:SAM-dependent methyltransferase
MPIRWVVDPEASATLWRELSELPLKLTGPGGRVVDLGGGNANFVWPLLRKDGWLVTVDVDRTALLAADPRVRAVAGSLLDLPFRDSALDGAGGRAVLHHVPNDLDRAFAEAKRVVRPGALLLFQEPTDGNPIANAARRRFPTERHDPHERPLPADVYLAAMRRELEVLEVRYEFLLSYLLPHIVGRLPPDRRGLARALTRFLFRLDRLLLSSLPNLRRRAAYVSILARRPETESSLGQR